MNYFIKRDMSEYGPYSLADLQKYLQSGQVAATDLCRSEGMTDWVPVTQVVGNVSVPTAAPVGQVYSGAPMTTFSQQPGPPNMHWGLVLLISFFTCGLFGTVWLLVLASFVKKVDEESKATLWLAIALIGLWVVPIGASVAGAEGTTTGSMLSGLGQIAGIVFYLVAIFQMKSSLEHHYLNQFGFARGLSGVMTFFFAPYYFQYHVNETEKMKAQAMGRVG